MKRRASHYFTNIILLLLNIYILRALITFHLQTTENIDVSI